MATGDKLVNLNDLKSVYDKQNGNVAINEASNVASAAHKKGSYFIYGGVLYQAIVNIASGETIVTSGSGKNCEASKIGQEITNEHNLYLLGCENIPNTIQTIAFDSSGNVSSITHKDNGNNTVRSDAFTFATNSITETRTLFTGDVMSIVTNLNTLITTVTFTAA